MSGMPRIHSPFFGHRHRDQEMIQRYGICKTDNSVGIAGEVEAEARRQVNARDRHKGRRASERATATREGSKEAMEQRNLAICICDGEHVQHARDEAMYVCICVCMHSRRAAASSSYVALQTPSWRRGYQTSRSVERRASSVGREPYICDAICDMRYCDPQRSIRMEAIASIKRILRRGKRFSRTTPGEQ